MGRCPFNSGRGKVRPFVQTRFSTICWLRVLALREPWSNSSGTGVLVKSGSQKPPKDPVLSNPRDRAPAAPARPCRAVALGGPGVGGSGQDRLWVGAPLPRCAPASHRRIPRILSPASGPCLRTREAFQTLAFKEPLLSPRAPFASSLLSFSLRTCSTERKGGGGGRRGGNLSRRPFQKAQHCSVRASRVCPCRTAGGFVLGSCFLAI